jgi:hypothetical protein
MTEAKHKVSEVYPAVRSAIAILLSQDKYDLAAAAAGAGLTLNKLREYLNRPSVRSYMRQQRQAQLEQICLQNATALAKLRDEGTNQVAVVNGIRTLETMLNAATDRAAGPVRKEPGLIIVIGDRGGERSVSIEPRLAGARSVERIAYERVPDPDEDPVDTPDADEALDAMPPPVRAPVKPARRK